MELKSCIRSRKTKARSSWLLRMSQSMGYSGPAEGLYNEFMWSKR